MKRLRAALLCSALLCACGGGTPSIPITEIDAGNDGGQDAGPDAGVLDTGDAGPCPTDPPPNAPLEAVVTPGSTTDHYLLKGRVATPESLFEPGQVLVANGKISCVGADCSGHADAAGATVIDTKGVIFPGLVDAHNHTQYNFLPPWVPSPPRLFDNRGQWAALPSYSAWTRPVNDNEQQYVCEQVKYGEIRALLGGVTTLQGTFNIDKICFRTLVHNAEYGHELGTARMRTNIAGADSISGAYATTLRDGMQNGDITAYVIHLAEGKDQKSRDELATLIGLGLLLPQTVLIHGTALNRADLTQVAAAHAKLVWSPLSNLVLYGVTTDVKTALELGIEVSLAPDWTLSGSPTLLAELKVAREHSCAAWGGLLDAKTLVQMVTSKPADALALTAVVGRLAPGLLADVLVIADRGQEAYRTLIEAKPDDVRLVMVAGNVRYGDAALVAATGRTLCESFSMCGINKRVCVADTTDRSDTNARLYQGLVEVMQVVSGFYSTPYRLDVCP